MMDDKEVASMAAEDMKNSGEAEALSAKIAAAADQAQMDEDLKFMKQPTQVTFPGQGDAAQKILDQAQAPAAGQQPKKPRGSNYTLPKAKRAWVEYVQGLNMRAMIARLTSKPKVKPTAETAMQSRRLQDRSKYEGNGTLRPVLEVSDIAPAEAAA